MSEQQNTALLVNDDSNESLAVVDFVGGLLESKKTYCSIDAKTPEERMQIANAMNNPTHRISDKINEVILIKDVYLETLMLRKKDEKGVESGEPQATPRIVLFDDKNESYQAVSVGLYSAIQKLMQVYGNPTWETPIPVKVKQLTRGDRKMLTLEVVSVAPSKK